MNAFCNADDISWGTKNLDTKRADHDAAKMRSKALAYKGGVLVRTGQGRVLKPCQRLHWEMHIGGRWVVLLWLVLLLVGCHAHGLACTQNHMPVLP